MQIQFNTRKKTYVATDRYGLVLGIYNPSEHGTVEEFARRMAELAGNA